MADMRAKKAGIGAEIEKKVEARYDEADAKGTVEAVRLWINDVVGADHEPIPSKELRDMHRHLQDGVMLCKMINKILTSQGKDIVKFKDKKSTFIAMGNIENYNKGVEELGMRKETLFQSTDLWEGRKAQFLNVINGLHSLGSKANEIGFKPEYTGVTIEYLD